MLNCNNKGKFSGVAILIQSVHAALALAAVLAFLSVLPCWFGACSSFAGSENVGADGGWNAFQTGGANNAITKYHMPEAPQEAPLRWAHSFETDELKGSNAVSPAIVVAGRIYVVSGKKIYELDRDTGNFVRESKKELAGDMGYALVPPTYGDGKIFVPINNGRVQAVDIDTLDPVWVTEPVGGQGICPVAYKEVGGKGMIFTGTWESNDGSYYAATTDDSDITDGVKKLKWRFTPKTDDTVYQKEDTGKRGFYWAGAYVSDKYVYVGSDAEAINGKTTDSVFYALDIETGDIADRIDGVKGNIRTTAVYDDGYIYFASQGGELYKVEIGKNGEFGDISSLDLGAPITTTPVIYNERLYVGVMESGSPHYSIVDISNDLSPASEIYKVNVAGSPQGSPVVSAPSSDSDAAVRVYFTCNVSTGGLYYFTDRKGATTATALSLYTPETLFQEYCISPLSVDAEGTIYYKNDSGAIFAVQRLAAFLKNMKINQDTGGSVRWKSGDFDKNVRKYDIVVDDDAKTATFEDLAAEVYMGTTYEVFVDGVSKGQDETISVNADGATVATIKVYGDDQTREYRFTFTRSGDDAELEILRLDSKLSLTGWDFNNVLTGEYDGAVTSYTTEKLTGSSSHYLYIKPMAYGSTIKVHGRVNVSKDTMYEGDEIDSVGSHKNEETKVFEIKPQDETKDTVVVIEVISPSGNNKCEYKVTILKDGSGEEAIKNAGSDGSNNNGTDQVQASGFGGNGSGNSSTSSNTGVSSNNTNNKNVNSGSAREAGEGMIKLAKTKITKIKKGKKRATIKFRKVKNAEKYQVAYRVGKKGKWKIKITKKTKTTLKKLKSKKKYQFRVRAFRNVGSKRYYAKWSKVRKVKIK